jgi:hypothetical protein
MKCRVRKPKKEWFMENDPKHCKSCMFANGCPNKNIENDKPCYRYRPKGKGR